jgi:hypothetical protein
MITGERYREVVNGVGLDRQAVEDEELLLAALLERADTARRDVKAFFDFVMKHEKSGQLLACAPHQRLLFDFVAAHPRCVVRMPVGTSKTYTMTALTLHLLGSDPTSRGCFVSATQGQAMKPVGMVRDYIESSNELRLVFPTIRKSPRKTDQWAQEAIVVERPAGIRDPSLRAVGLDGAIDGSRLNWIVVDDILNRENTSTKASREKVFEWFDTSVLSRIDPDGGRIVVTNTPWHLDDLTFRLERSGWPTLTMGVTGDITLANCDDFDSADIAPSTKPGEVYRLAAHDEPRNDRGHVSSETTPLWPVRYSWDEIRSLRESSGHGLQRFNQLYMCVCRAEETAKCKVEWIERCKEAGRGIATSARYTGSGLTITGVDLAVGKGAQYDNTALFTFEQLDDGRRRILDVDFGQWDAPTIVGKIIAKNEQFRSLVMVENNAAQDYIRQFVLARNASIPIKAHTTGRNRAHPEYGIEGLFIELQNGAWIIPCTLAGTMAPGVAKWVEECLYYQPEKHPGDVLMASWLAIELARQMGFGAGRRGGQAKPMNLASSLLAR